MPRMIRSLDELLASFRGAAAGAAVADPGNVNGNVSTVRVVAFDECSEFHRSTNAGVFTVESRFSMTAIRDGDPRTTLAAVWISERRAKLLGLDAGGQRGAPLRVTVHQQVRGDE